MTSALCETLNKKKKKVVDLTLIKTKAKIHSILRGRPQIGQNLTDDSVGLLPYTPIKSNKEIYLS